MKAPSCVGCIGNAAHAAGMIVADGRYIVSQTAPSACSALAQPGARVTRITATHSQQPARSRFGQAAKAQITGHRPYELAPAPGNLAIASAAAQRRQPTASTHQIRPAAR